MTLKCALTVDLNKLRYVPVVCTVSLFLYKSNQHFLNGTVLAKGAFSGERVAEQPSCMWAGNMVAFALVAEYLIALDLSCFVWRVEKTQATAACKSVFHAGVKVSHHFL